MLLDHVHIVRTHAAHVRVQWTYDVKYIQFHHSTHCLTVPKWQCISVELSFIVLEHERNSASEASWNEPNKFWTNEKTHSTAAEDDCTSKIFSAVADQHGKSLECFFHHWRGSASFSKMTCLRNRADFCGARKLSISDGQIGPADGSDELAVLVKSLKHD